jgi:predicted DNA-binding transcriptional regulator YafY
LALVYKQGVVYLVASDQGIVKQFVLHRMLRAELTYRDAEIPSGFTLDGYIEDGHFASIGGSEEIQLKLRFGRYVACHLRETPLSEDQVVKSFEEGFAEVTATVKNSDELRWWILGFGNNVEVLEPVELRAEIKHTLGNMCRLYDD